MSCGCVYVCAFVIGFHKIKISCFIDMHTHAHTHTHTHTHRYGYVRLDGSMSIKKRQKIVDKFNDPTVSSSCVWSKRPYHVFDPIFTCILVHVSTSGIVLVPII